MITHILSSHTILFGKLLTMGFLWRAYTKKNSKCVENTNTVGFAFVALLLLSIAGQIGLVVVEHLPVLGDIVLQLLRDVINTLG